MSEARNRAVPGGIEQAAAAYYASLHRTAARILGCPDAARDAVQEALIALWLDPPPHTPEYAWLVRTVVHRSLHHRRTGQRRKRWEREAADVADDCVLCDPERAAQAEEARALVDDALRVLPEPYRCALMRREIDGWDYEQIARSVGVPIGTVRSRLNRAKLAVRAYLSARQANGA